VTFLVERWPTRGVLGWKLLRDAGIVRLRTIETQANPAAVHPLFEAATSIDHGNGDGMNLPALPASGAAANSSPFHTAEEYASAYRSGRTTPLAVAEGFLSALNETEQLDPPMRVFISQDPEDLLEMARASTERYASGTPLGPLDGVPVAVKDEVDQVPYPTTVGTSFMGRAPATEDAFVVSRFRAAGALLLGKANMHELGMGVTGLNPHHGAARNPYDPSRATGGSSSGSAAAVASGLCPIAVGADGGGSIRIPAALCGVVGLKPTFGRISEHGAAPLCWSLAHLGPIAATARDAAIGYAQMAGRDAADGHTRYQPAPTLEGLENGDLSGVRIGIYAPWFGDADPEIVRECTRAVDAFVDRGAQRVEVTISDLHILRTVHLVSIISEMATSQLSEYGEHRGDYGCDTRLNLALARQLKATDYVHAQRHRTDLCRQFEEVLSKVDLVATPATGCTAPILPRDALRTGESNLNVTDRIMRFAQVANLTGLPAISFPVGYDSDGLPIALQLMGRAWHESLLLRMARVAEEFVTRSRPRVLKELLLPAP